MATSNLTLPAFLQTSTTDTSILAAMLATLPATLDQAQGGFLYDALSPAAFQLAQAAIWAQLQLQYSFITTAYGNYIDLRATEQGLTRLAATPATGSVTFTGSNGTVVPAGTVVATASSTAAPSQGFATTAAVTIGLSGSVSATVSAVTPGTSGNVGASTIVLLTTPVAGVSGVTNSSPLSGGTDIETDAALVARYLVKVQNPSAGGNKADYVNWALAVSGVGGVSVVPIANGPGTVSVALIDLNKQPATQALIDTVQAVIAPAWDFVKEAETMTLGGAGGSIDTTQTDASGTCVKFVNGTIAAPATAPTASLVASSGNVDVGSHVYAVTFLGQSGETTAGPSSTIITTSGGNQQVSLTVIPTGGGGTITRNLYRSKAGTTTPLYLLTTLADNVTTTFLDNVADASLGAASPGSNTAVSDGTLQDATTSTLVADFAALTPSRGVQAGVWQARVRAKVSATSGTDELCEVGVWNTSAARWAYTSAATALLPPAAPSLTTAATGGTLAAGVYQVVLTYTDAAGETTASVTASLTTTGSTSTLIIASPLPTGNASGWYAYVTQPGGSTFVRQQAPGAPTAIGTNLTLTAPPTSVGANPPGANTTIPLTANAVATYTGAQLSTSFANVIQPFFWNGTDTVQLQVTRIGPALPAPTVAPTLGHAANGTTLLAGTYTVGYSWLRGSGETTVGTTATVTISAGDDITVTLPAFPANVTAANVYVSQAAGSSTLKRAATVTGTSLTVYALPTGALVPGANTTGGDTTTNLWVDNCDYHSTFSTDTGLGKAPIGAQVAVQAATAVTVAVTATLTYVTGYVASAVQTAINAALTTYLQGLAFNATNPNVHYAVIGATILDVAGVANYTALTVNGGTADIAISATQVAVLGQVVWS